MTQENIELLIIGSGPAGYTAAIYAARAGIKPVVYQGMQPGGQLTITTEVENYPGFPGGIQGPALMANFAKQAEHMGAELRYGLVTKVDFSSRPFKVWIDEAKLVEAKAVIISTGASARWLGIESEQRLNGFGVSACAVCDGFFFKGQEVAIVGAGDTAAEEALYLSKLCSHVHMIVRRDEMRASSVMQNRVKAMPNITIHWNTETVEIVGEHSVSGVRVKNTQTGELSNLTVSGFFVAIGHTPNSAIFKGWLDIDEAGYIKILPGTSKTNVEGVFAAGDIQDKVYRQAVTAAGSGCIAALDAERFLAVQEFASIVEDNVKNTVEVD